MNNNRSFLSVMLLSAFFTFNSVFSANAYPIFAQQNYANPREANGRIVCANCHLAQKPVEIETPQAILPNSIFEAKVKIPYDNSRKQILSNGQKGNINVGAVVILPEGFKLAPKNLMSKERIKYRCFYTFYKAILSKTSIMISLSTKRM